ncbi:MAG: hypothetical protein F4076_13610, partial [Acidimicrobiaceae bacterium]|nr:hypothetical protein [Acidimicrobiaceae bacterium]MYJ43448.1 hypothetical protein [Acidimicrobiaceae bacterium]
MGFQRLQQRGPRGICGARLLRPEEFALTEGSSGTVDHIEFFGEKAAIGLTPAHLVNDLYGSKALLRSAAGGRLGDDETEL